MQERTALNGIAFLALMIYLLLAAATFPSFVEASLNGKSDWRVYADSPVYAEVADYIRQRGSGDAMVELLALSHNVILPALISLVLKTNGAIASFNVLVFLGSLILLAKTFPNFKWYVFLPLMLAAPTTYQALLTLNKEIFVFSCAVGMARWFKTGSVLLIGSVILLSLLLRWEQALVIVCFLVLLKLNVTPKRAAIFMIVGISVLYPSAIAFVDLPEDVKGSTSSEFYAKLNILQDHGLYFALLLPKAIISLLSQVIRFWVPFLDSERLHDLPTGVFVLFDQLCMCWVVIMTIRGRLWRASNPLMYFALVFCVIYFAAPENSPRYLYMLYVLMSALLSSSELQALRMPERTARTGDSYRGIDEQGRLTSC